MGFFDNLFGVTTEAPAAASSQLNNSGAAFDPQSDIKKRMAKVSAGAMASQGINREDVNIKARFHRNVINQSSDKAVIAKRDAAKEQANAEAERREAEFMMRFETFKDNPRIQVNKIEDNEMFYIDGKEVQSKTNAQIIKNDAVPVNNENVTHSTASRQPNFAQQIVNETVQKKEIPVGTPVNPEDIKPGDVIAQGFPLTGFSPRKKPLPPTPSTPAAKPVQNPSRPLPSKPMNNRKTRVLPPVPTRA